MANYVATTDTPSITRGVALALPSADLPLTYPDREISGRVYDNQGASVVGAETFLIRQRDGVTVAQQISGTNGGFLYIRDGRDTNSYYVVAFSMIDGTIQVHGTTNRGLQPALM